MVQAPKALASVVFILYLELQHITKKQLYRVTLIVLLD